MVEIPDRDVDARAAEVANNLSEYCQEIHDLAMDTEAGLRIKFESQ